MQRIEHTARTLALILAAFAVLSLAAPALPGAHAACPVDVSRHENAPTKEGTIGKEFARRFKEAQAKINRMFEEFEKYSKDLAEKAATVPETTDLTKDYLEGCRLQTLIRGEVMQLQEDLDKMTKELETRNKFWADWLERVGEKMFQNLSDRLETTLKEYEMPMYYQPPDADSDLE